jgi:hypothetical protein
MLPVELLVLGVLILAAVSPYIYSLIIFMSNFILFSLSSHACAILVPSAA